MTTLNEGAVGICRCGGVWLDNAMAEQLLTAGLVDPTRSRLRALFNAARRPEKKAANYRTADRSLGGARLCVECGQPLTLMATDPALHGAQIQLDVCEGHGVWFDPGEAWSLLQIIELRVLGAEVAQQTEERTHAWGRRLGNAIDDFLRSIANS